MKIGAVMFVASALAAGNAVAQDYDDDGDDAESGLVTKYGLSITAGGGVAGFTDETLRDTADVGGTWDVRAAFGTHYPIALEAGYIGSAQSIDAVGLDTDAVLVGTAFEGLARVNLLPQDRFNPYFFGGAAWRRYDVTNADTNTSDVSETDNLLEIPVGIGVNYRLSGFVADARGEFRIAGEEDLIRTDLGADNARMHTWSASAKLGYEFKTALLFCVVRVAGSGRSSTLVSECET
jgi:hypothetical protein